MLADDSLYSDVTNKKRQIYQETVSEIERYLNDIRSIAATFTQYAPDRSTSTGTLYILRPGNIKWEYDAPNPITITAKGSLLVYEDRELEQISHVTLDHILANFLTAEKISFNNQVKITGFTKKNNNISITIEQQKVKSDGRLTLNFVEEPLELTGLEMIDAAGQSTVIQFNSLISNVALDKSLFAFPR